MAGMLDDTRPTRCVHGAHSRVHTQCVCVLVPGAESPLGSLPCYPDVGLQVGDDALFPGFWRIPGLPKSIPASNP